MLLLIRCALGYDMGPGARPVILPVTAPRNRAREYLANPHKTPINVSDNGEMDTQSILVL